MNTYKLFLDDERIPESIYRYSGIKIYNSTDWTIVKSYTQFIQKIQSNYALGYFPEIVSFDHDLADEHKHSDMYNISADVYNKHYGTFKERTGLDCAKWFINFCNKHNLKFPTIYVHSMNPVGRQNILNLFNSHN